MKSIVDAFNSLVRHPIAEPREPETIKSGIVLFNLDGYREARLINSKANPLSFFQIQADIMTNCQNASHPEMANFWIYQDGGYRKRDDFLFQIQRSVYEILQTVGLNKDDYHTIGRQLVIRTLPFFEQFIDFDDTPFLENDEFPVFLKDRIVIITKDKIKELPTTPAYNNRFAIPHIPERIDTPLFDAHLKHITGGDEDFIKSHLQITSTILTPVRLDHNIYFLVGEGGEGKSVDLAIKREIVGVNNATALNLQNIMPTTIEMLSHSLINISTESASGTFDEALIKALSSGDLLCANPKYRQPFGFIPRAKLFFSMNKKPSLTDLSNSIRRRLVVLPFNYKIITPDLNFVAKIKRELGGILYKLILQLQSVIGQGGIFKAKIINETTNEYFTSCNSVALFITDIKRVIASHPDLDFLRYEDKTTFPSVTREYFRNLEISGGEITCIFTIFKLYDCYQSWCRRFSYKPNAFKSFKETIWQINQQDKSLSMRHNARKEHLIVLKVDKNENQ